LSKVVVDSTRATVWVLSRISLVSLTGALSTFDASAFVAVGFVQSGFTGSSFVDTSFKIGLTGDMGDVVCSELAFASELLFDNGLLF